MTADLRNRLSRPRPVLRIGVVGHTSCQVDRGLEGTVQSVLSQLCEFASECSRQDGKADAFSQQPVSAVRLVTGLAPGFDTLAWTQWHSLSPTSSQARSTLVILPSLLSQYRDRLQQKGASVEALRALERELEASPGSGSPAVASLELESGQGSQDQRVGEDAHAARLVVQNCDVLIAYWNGLERRQTTLREHQSLTFRAVQFALRIGIPVLWLPDDSSGSGCAPDTETGRDLDATEELRRLLINVSRDTAWMNDLRKHVCFLLHPAKRRSSDREQEQAQAREHSMHHLRTAPVRVLRFLCGKRKAAPNADPSAPQDLGLSEHQLRQLDALLAEPDPKRIAWRVRFLGTLWNYVWRRIDHATTPPPSGTGSASSESAATEPAEPPLGRTYVHYERCDRLALTYMSAYRGAFCAIYLLGSLAVALAAMAFLAVTLGGKSWALALGIAELLVIGAILRLRASSIRLRLRERATQYRRLAELLRLSSWTFLIGRPLGKIALPAHRGDERTRTSWVGWLHDAWIREVDLPGAEGEERRAKLPAPDLLNLINRLRSGWVADQIDYHRRTARRYRGLSAGIEDVVSALFVVLLLVVFVSVVFGGLALAYPDTIWADIAKVLKLVALPVATVFPALAGALHGIKTQLEADRLEQNSESMVEHLEELDARLRTLPDSPSGASLEQFEPLVHRACTIMLHELDDWHASHVTHEMPLP